MSWMYIYWLIQNFGAVVKFGLNFSVEAKLEGVKMILER